MTLNEQLEQLRALELKQYAYNYASSMIYLDGATTAPTDAAEGRAKAMEVLTEESYKATVNPEVTKLLNDLAEEREEWIRAGKPEGPWTDQLAREVELEKRSLDQISRIPMKEYVEYQVLLVEADDVWHKAKEQSDFELFRPCLEKLVETNRRFAGYYDATKAPYDALLNEYERGVSMESLDKFFAQVRAQVVPLLKAVQAKPQVDDSFRYRDFPIDRQRQLTDYVMAVMGHTKEHCVCGETEHPFTLEFNNKDVRITTHYFENDVLSSLYSVIHEAGHALYERGIDDAYAYTAVTGGVSMGVHESQSRFYENIIGRSKAFCTCLLPKLQELFPESMKGVTAEGFYLAANKAEPSLIRTEADELTYSLHVMVRYEIEKQLIGGTLAVKDVPAEWNRLYKEYLGVDVPDDKHGCLQDSHWSGGSFGYFPSYALGSAYGAQMLAQMETEFDLWGEVAKGNLQPVTDWLCEKIHRHGSMQDPGDLMRQVFSGEFDPSYYTEYLKKKYTEIYGL